MAKDPKKVKAVKVSWLYTDDPSARTQPGRTAFEETFFTKAREMFPDADEADIERRAGILRQIHFIDMGIKSGEARRAKAARRQLAPLGGA